MRIIIEVDDRAEATVQTLPKLGSVEAQNAGTPSEELLRLVEAEAPELTLVPEAVDMMDAGSPSQLPQEAIEEAISTGVDTMGGEAIDAGAAPVIEE